MSKIKALVLDAGGVLVHPLHSNWNIPVKYREMMGSYADEIPGEKWLEACRAEAAYLREDVFIKDLEEEYGLRLQFLRAVARRRNWVFSEEKLAELAHDFTYNVNRYAWYADSLPWLKHWYERMKVGILSDAMPSFPHVLHSHEAHNYIHSYVISTEIGTSKPDARMYNEICARLNAAPGECLFVDDRVCNLEGAMNVGMRAVQMCRDGLEEWNGDAVHDLAELNDYLEGLN